MYKAKNYLLPGNIQKLFLYGEETYKLVIDRYWFFYNDTDTDYLHVYVPDNRYAEPIFIYCYKVNQ